MSAGLSPVLHFVRPHVVEINGRGEVVVVLEPVGHTHRDVDVTYVGVAVGVSANGLGVGGVVVVATNLKSNAHTVRVS